MLTSKVARLVVADPFITAQPVSQSLRVGEDVTMNIAAVGTEPLSYQWRKNGTNLLGSAAVSLTLTNVQGTDAGEYQVIVSNLFGQVTSSTVLLSVNLATPDAFDPGPSSAVYGMAMLPDSTVLVGGNFITIGIQRRDYLARLNVDGSLHTTFDSGANSWVNSFSIQSNGRTLVTGAFTSLGGQSSKGFSRLNADGSFDPTFNPELNNGVRPVSEQADGRILVGGDFMSAGPQQRRFIGRLNADGSLDASFNSDANNSVTCLVDQGDGKVLLGGWFTALGGQTHRYIGRLNSDGSPDGSFTADANGAVRSLAVQADGRIILGGEFTMLTGEPRPHLGRLNADGSLDGTFNPGADSLVWALSLQTDGKILVAGAFTTLGDQLRRCIGRLDVDGSLDATFAPRIDRNDLVRCLAVQADGKILVGGDFRTLDGQARIDIGRLNNTGPAIENLAFDGWTLTWRRSGTSPEVWRTSFEISTNGTDWASLGTGQRIPGGWQLAGVRMPTNATIRARGFVSGGGISSWFVETTAGPFAFTNRPALSIARNGSLPFLSISGDVGSLYALEFVPALTPINAWQPLTLLSLTNSPQTYLDPSASGVTQRFYRARLNQ